MSTTKSTLDRNLLVVLGALCFTAVGVVLGLWESYFHVSIYGLIGFIGGAFVGAIAGTLYDSKGRFLKRAGIFTITLTASFWVALVGLSVYRHWSKIWAVSAIEQSGAKIFDMPMKGWFSVEFNASTEIDDPLHELAPHLAALPSFSICFSENSYTDSNMRAVTDDLARIPRLHGVSFINTRVSIDTIQYIKSALPECWVSVRNDKHNPSE